MYSLIPRPENDPTDEKSESRTGQRAPSEHDEEEEENDESEDEGDEDDGDESKDEVESSPSAMLSKKTEAKGNKI